MSLKHAIIRFLRRLNFPGIRKPSSCLTEAPACLPDSFVVENFGRWAEKKGNDEYSVVGRMFFLHEGLGKPFQMAVEVITPFPGCGFVGFRKDTWKLFKNVFLQELDDDMDLTSYLISVGKLPCLILKVKHGKVKYQIIDGKDYLQQIWEEIQGGTGGWVDVTDLQGYLNSPTPVRMILDAIFHRLVENQKRIESQKGQTYEALLDLMG